MVNVEKNPFLICKNCVNWGVRWKLRWRIRECSRIRDDDGKYYTANHAACKHFVPKQGVLPLEIQQLRLFAQALTQAEANYLGWAISQRQGLLELKDSRNQELCMGDHVQFRHGIQAYYGTIEGCSPDNPDAIIVNSPAFENATITLLSSSVRKLEPQELKSFIRKAVPVSVGQDHEWQIDAIANEIATMKASKGLDEMDEDERFHLACLELELRNKNSLLRYFKSFKP